MFSSSYNFFNKISSNKMEIDNNILLYDSFEDNCYNFYLRISIPGEFIVARLEKFNRDGDRFELFFEDNISITIRKTDDQYYYELNVKNSIICNPIRFEMIKKFQCSDAANVTFRDLFLMICEKLDVKN